MCLHFDDVTVDLVEQRVTVGGRTVDVPPRVFATLKILVEHADRVVSRAEIAAAVWPTVHVESNSVSQAVKAVRALLADGGAGGRIRTVPRRGYCFTGPVRGVTGVASPTPSPGACDPPGDGPCTGAGWRARVPGAPRARRRLGLLAAAAAFAVFCGAIVLNRAVSDTARAEALYRAGAELLTTRRAADIHTAAAIFAQATAADPRHYEALTALAQARYLIGFYGIDRSGGELRLAREAADTAIELAPHRAPAYAIRASIALDRDWDLAGSAADFGRAVRLEPDDPLTRHWAAWWCLAAARMDDARATLDAAVARDPFSAPVLTARATFAYLDGDTNAAVADAQQALLLDPGFFRAHLRLGLARLLGGDEDDAVAHLERAHDLAPDVPEAASALAHAYAATGRREQAVALFSREAHSWPDYERAIVLTGLKQYRAALEALSAAKRAGRLVPGLFTAEPRLRELRSFPEFQTLRAFPQLADQHLAAPLRTTQHP